VTARPSGRSVSGCRRSPLCSWWPRRACSVDAARGCLQRNQRMRVGRIGSTRIAGSSGPRSTERTGVPHSHCPTGAGTRRRDGTTHSKTDADEQLNRRVQLARRKRYVPPDESDATTADLCIAHSDRADRAPKDGLVPCMDRPRRVRSPFLPLRPSGAGMRPTTRRIAPLWVRSSHDGGGDAAVAGCPNRTEAAGPARRSRHPRKSECRSRATTSRAPWFSPISSISASPRQGQPPRPGSGPGFAPKEDQALARLQRAATDALDKCDSPGAGTGAIASPRFRSRGRTIAFGSCGLDVAAHRVGNRALVGELRAVRRTRFLAARGSSDHGPSTRPSSGQGGGGGWQWRAGCVRAANVACRGLTFHRVSWLGRRRGLACYEVDLLEDRESAEDHGRTWR
jgi:hypothetical protein